MQFIRHGCPSGSFCSFCMFLATILFSTIFLIFGMAAVIAAFLAALDSLGIAQDAPRADLLVSSAGCAAVSAVALLVASFCARRSE